MTITEYFDIILAEIDFKKDAPLYGYDLKIYFSTDTEYIGRCIVILEISSE
jgi:hypothetical protein